MYGGGCCCRCREAIEKVEARDQRINDLNRQILQLNESLREQVRVMSAVPALTQPLRPCDAPVGGLPDCSVRFVVVFSCAGGLAHAANVPAPRVPQPGNGTTAASTAGVRGHGRQHIGHVRCFPANAVWNRCLAHCRPTREHELAVSIRQASSRRTLCGRSRLSVS